MALSRWSSRSSPPAFQSTRSTACTSGSTKRSPSGAHSTGRITLPSARACASSIRHQVEASQFGVSTRMTAWQRASSSYSRRSQFSPAPIPLSLSKSRKTCSKPSFASDALMSSETFWSRLEWLMKMAGMGSRNPADGRRAQPPCGPTIAALWRRRTWRKAAASCHPRRDRLSDPDLFPAGTATHGHATTSFSSPATASAPK